MDEIQDRIWDCLDNFTLACVAFDPSQTTGVFDFNGDCEILPDDLAGFVECLHGPGGQPKEGSEIDWAYCLGKGDIDRNGAVDLFDFAVLQTIIRNIPCKTDFDCPDNANECTIPVCMDGSCTFENATDGTPCHDSDICTENEVCQAGVCVGDPIQECCESNADCNEGFFCTDQVCVNGECVITPVDARCDDGLFCTGVATCNPQDLNADADGCVLPGNPCGNIRPVCDEATDTCNACTSNAECDDGIPCTDDLCNGVTGDCVSVRNDNNCAEGEVCDPTVGCVEGDCVEVEDCAEDGEFCTGDPVCDGGVCGFTGNPCAASTPLCCEGTDVCATECCEDADCPDDGQFCTGERVCDNGVCSFTGNPCSGTTPICVEATDECRACEDDIECDNGVPCTTDSCEANGSCSNDPDDDFCDDGLFCTANDTCDPNSADADANGCVNEGDPCNCNENPAECGGAFGTVAGFDPTARKLCNETDDTCDDCVANAECDDGIGCTSNACDGATGICTNTRNNALCDDELFCTENDVCDPDDADADANGCVNSGNPCDPQLCEEGEDAAVCVACTANAECANFDGIACTDDVCNGQTGDCVAVRNDDNCAAGEVCDPAVGCVDGDCVDNADCAVDEVCVDNACVPAP